MLITFQCLAQSPSQAKLRVGLGWGSARAWFGLGSGLPPACLRLGSGLVQVRRGLSWAPLGIGSGSAKVGLRLGLGWAQARLGLCSALACAWPGLSSGSALAHALIELSSRLSSTELGVPLLG